MDEMELKTNEVQYHWPLAIVKQAVMKLDSFMTDIHEIREEPDIDEEDKQTLDAIAGTADLMLAYLVNMIREECEEEDFMNEDIQMDPIDSYPDKDILDQAID